MITPEQFMHVVHLLGAQATEDIAWAESLKEPEDANRFALEAIFVICNSGMHNKIARVIFNRCDTALSAGRPVFEVFKHPGKAAAIEHIWANKIALFQRFYAAPDRLAFLAELPWIGDVTKYHLAKNFGMNVAKPDVHLQRLADREGCTVHSLCDRLAKATGWRIATVDTLLWRACANDVIDSRTGAIEGCS